MAKDCVLGFMAATGGGAVALGALTAAVGTAHDALTPEGHVPGTLGERVKGSQQPASVPSSTAP